MKVSLIGTFTLLDTASFLFWIYGILFIIWDTFWIWQFSALECYKKSNQLHTINTF